MRRLLWGAALALLVGASHAQKPLPFEHYLYSGRVHAYYGTANTPEQIQLLTAVRQFEMAERMARLAQGTLRLRHDLTVAFTSCGRPSAFFAPKQSAIVICLEMMELLAKLAASDPSLTEKKAFAVAVEGALWGIYFHELAHAVISINRVPITGREEDVADQFAVYFATNYIEPHGALVVMPTIWLFQQLARQRDLATADHDSIKRLMADEHSLDEQRTYNLACWALGANHERGRAAAQMVNLPAERASRCQAEFARMQYGMRSLFQKYMHVKR